MLCGFTPCDPMLCGLTPCVPMLCGLTPCVPMLYEFTPCVPMLYEFTPCVPMLWFNPLCPKLVCLIYIITSSVLIIRGSFVPKKLDLHQTWPGLRLFAPPPNRSCPSEGEAGVSLRAKRLMTVRELFVRAYRSSVSETQDQAVGNITRTFSGLLSRIANSL